MLGSCSVGVTQQNGELFPTQTSTIVRVDAFGHDLENKIARGVSVGVVDGFESIKVDEDDGQLGLILVRQIDLLMRNLIEESPVAQACEYIVLRGVLCLRKHAKGLSKRGSDGLR